MHTDSLGLGAATLAALLCAPAAAWAQAGDAAKAYPHRIVCFVNPSSPDGHTVLIAATGIFVTNPLVYTKLSYSEKDFETISIVADAPFILTVHPSVPARKLAELVALAKALKVPEAHHRSRQLRDGRHAGGIQRPDPARELGMGEVVKNTGIKPE